MVGLKVEQFSYTVLSYEERHWLWDFYVMRRAPEAAFFSVVSTQLGEAVSNPGSCLPPDSTSSGAGSRLLALLNCEKQISVAY